VVIAIGREAAGRANRTEACEAKRPHIPWHMYVHRRVRRPLMCGMHVIKKVVAAWWPAPKYVREVWHVQNKMSADVAMAEGRLQPAHTVDTIHNMLACVSFFLLFLFRLFSPPFRPDMRCDARSKRKCAPRYVSTEIPNAQLTHEAACAEVATKSACSVLRLSAEIRHAPVGRMLRLRRQRKRCKEAEKNKRAQHWRTYPRRVQRTRSVQRRWSAQVTA